MRWMFVRTLTVVQPWSRAQPTARDTSSEPTPRRQEPASTTTPQDDRHGPCLEASVQADMNPADDAAVGLGDRQRLVGQRCELGEPLHQVGWSDRVAELAGQLSDARQVGSGHHAHDDVGHGRSCYHQQDGKGIGARARGRMSVCPRAGAGPKRRIRTAGRHRRDRPNPRCFSHIDV